MPIRVLTVDDSPLFLEVLAGIIAATPGLLVAGSARNGREAVEKVIELSPDIVTLDVEMPVMDGLETLGRIMSIKPTPVIMVSSHTRRASAATIKALLLGACDFVTKPDRPLQESLGSLRVELVEKITAICARPHPQSMPRPSAPGTAFKGRKPRVLVIGGSTGGTPILSRILTALPARMDFTLVAVQHLPGLFTQEFAHRLAEIAPCPVHQARDGDLVERGQVFIAPGGFQLSIYGNTFRVSRGEPVNGYRPSVDVTMSSVARRFCPEVCGVLLTGIGRDGAQGIRDVKAGGGFTIAQDEASSVVFGMPKAAIATGSIDCVLSDAAIASEIAAMARK
jgi:two-component system, chemotaxis family, protein-glutamate methylesterase/glutaminase